jgi:hypothetical protein
MMVWQIHGNAIEFSLTKNGLEIEGTGKQYPSANATIGVNMSEVRDLPAHWSMHRAVRDAELAVSLGFGIEESQHYLNSAMVARIEKPLTIISFYGPTSSECNASIGFSTFLSESDFADAWRLAQLVANGAPMRYWMNYDFAGFIPVRATSEQLMPHEASDPLLMPVCYSDWLSGRPYFSRGFSLRLLRIDGDRNENATQTPC